MAPTNLLLIRLVHYVFGAYYAVLLVRVAFSWLGSLAFRPGWRTLYTLSHAVTEPLLRPLRSVLRRYTGAAPIDFSPMLLWGILFFVERLLTGLLLRS